MLKFVGRLLSLMLIATFPGLVQAQALQVVWIDPIRGPYCAGPLGPGPCAQVAQWMATRGVQSIGIPLPNTLPTTLPMQPGGAPPSIDGMQPLNMSISAHAPEVIGAAQCAQLTGQSQQIDVNSFLVCTRGALVLDKDSATIVSCLEQANGNRNNLVQCAGRGIIGSKLNPDQLKAVNCAAKNSDDADDFADCIANGLIGGRLSPQQRGVLNCAANNDLDSGRFAGCAAQAMFGGQMSPEANAAIDCAVQSQGDYQQFGGCAANKFLGLRFNPEQQIALQCVASSGGQPYVAAGCAASRLTARELTKCLQHGIGGSSGCFGDNNDLTGRNGFVVRNIVALA